METLYAIIISSAIIICILIYMLYKMAKLKEQNDMIYRKKIEENKLMDKCKKIAEETEWEKAANKWDSKPDSKKEILAFRNFGKKSLDELEKLMNEHNLKFKE